MAERVRKFGNWFNKWRCFTIVAIIAFISVLVALIVVSVAHHGDQDDLKKNTIPCPPSKGGLMTSGDPQKPSPFHDLTSAEYKRVYRYLLSYGQFNLRSGGRINSASIFMMDLLLPPKQEVLSFLDKQFPQPAREARVMVFRGDKSPPVVEEYRVGPLSRPTYSKLIVNPKRRNPVPFSFRPIGHREIRAWKRYLFPKVDKKVAHILIDSYGGRFTNCGDKCLTIYPVPVGTQLLGNITRKIWLMTAYPVPEYYTLYTTDFGFLINVEDTDPTNWTVEDVWYSGALYTSLDDLVDKYANDPTTSKTSRGYVDVNGDQTSMQKLMGSPVPETPQRPPVQMEPDGKRYTIHHHHVKYMNWNFDLRMSAFTGPQVHDVRFNRDRIAYELGLSEIAVFYSGHSPMQRVNNFVNSGLLPGTQARSLIPGVDCPEGATFLNVSFFGEGRREPTTRERAQCVFEHNTGVPLRRHVSYAGSQGSFYGGMADSVLIVRSILTISNYDYIIDFVFHQNGAIECRAMCTGYIINTRYVGHYFPYRFLPNVDDTMHHHMFHFKADLDIGSTSNRYETLNISQEQVQLRQVPRTTFKQTKITQHLYKTENQAVYDFNFSAPLHHIIYNEQWKTSGIPRAYRLHMAGMSKQVLTPGENNEKSIPWARQQLAVTVQKDEELVSSSPYAMFDSLNPVADFSTYIDSEGIVDKDLVFWITMGSYHIPHTEDIPVTTTPGSHLSFFLLPYNYFPECPSVSSRDNVRVEKVRNNKSAEILKVDRSGNQETRVCGALTLEQLVRDRPDDVL